MKRVVKDILGKLSGDAPPCKDIMVEWRDKKVLLRLSVTFIEI